MKRWMFVLGMALALGMPTAALAQARPDFSGTWRFSQEKSNPGISGNTPTVPFPSQIVIKQSATELHVLSTSVRQAPISAVYKLDGSSVTLDAPQGITETGMASFEGQTLVIATRRAYPSPAGEIVANFKDVLTLNGNDLTIERTRTQDGDSTSEKAVFEKQ
jgi:hypothetical protein